ncbi:MAG: glycosyltransferase family 4 protein [Deltaproteobacteria bacterium]
MGKKKILISDTAPLYPPLWGGPKRIWNLFGRLPEDEFDLTYVGVGCGFPKGMSYSFDRVTPNLRQILVALPVHYRPWNRLERSLFPDRSLDLFLYLGMHTCRQFTKLLNSFEPDAVVLSHPWAARSLRSCSAKVVYDAHNCEYLLMEQILGSHPLRGAVLAAVRDAEGEAVRRSSVVLVCSEQDRRALERLYRLDGKEVVLVPNGTDPAAGKGEEERRASRCRFGLREDEQAAIFVGSYYKPNICAARWIIRTLAPALPRVRFLIVGTVADAFRGETVPPNVILFGRATESELEDAFTAADVAVNPITEGSGVNIKMLDYMAHGLPIVTTGFGARGIEREGDGQSFLVSPLESFAGAIGELLADAAKRQALSECAARTVRARFDWRDMRETCRQLLLSLSGEPAR